MTPIPCFPARLGWLFGLLLVLGLLFRLSHLDQKIFWVDEVATVVRAVGYTKAEIVAQLADGQTHTVADLLAYQRLTPNRSLNDTLIALSRSPEHAPLYFLLTRFWMAALGSSVGAIRSLSVISSLLALPALGWLCRELFGWGHGSVRSVRSVPNRVGLVAVALLAVSPYFVAYAQEARPYSLWLLTVLLCWAALLRALRLNSPSSWVIYGGSLVLSLYTSLLTLLLAVGQLCCVGVITQPLKQTRTQVRIRFGLALGAATVLFSPWIWILLHQQQALEANTTWMRTAISPLAMLAIWLYSLAIIWFDLPVIPTGWMAGVQATIATLVLAGVGYAAYQFNRWNPPRTTAAWLALGLPIPLVLILVDLVFQGQASATSRYLMPTQLAALIAVAFLCSPALPVRGPQSRGRQSAGWLQPRPAQLILSGLLALSLVSNGVNFNRSPDYQKARNQANPDLAALVNQMQIDQNTRAAVPLWAEPSQTLDLLSLSRSLLPSVPIRIAAPQPLLDALPTVVPTLVPTAANQALAAQSACRSVLLFNPSSALLAAASQRGFQLQQLYQPALLTEADVHLTLWQLSCAANP
jgi:uncharacterized membrane protein